MTIIDDLDPKEMTQDKRDEYAACWISDNAPDIVIDYLDQREAEYRVAIERAAILINLLTVHQVNGFIENLKGYYANY